MSLWHSWQQQSTGLVHVIEAVQGGQYVRYCDQALCTSLYSGRIAYVFERPLTCLWCAAWWTP